MNVLREAAGILVFSIRRAGIRRPDQEEGIRFRLVFGRIDGREQLDAVAHGDQAFSFGVMGADENGVFESAGLGLGRCAWYKQPTCKGDQG